MTTTLDARITARLRAPDYREWRAQVQATGGCAAPIHLLRLLRRSSTATAPSCSNAAGTVLAPCGNRRAAVCPACSDRYAADAYHLLRAGLAGDDTKNVPDTRHRAPAGIPDPDRALVRAGPHPHAHPPRARHPLPLRRPAPPRRPPHRHRPRPRQLRLHRRGALAGPRRRSCGHASPSPCAAPWPPRSASGPASSRTTPGCPTPRSPSTSAAGWCTSTPSSASTAPTDPPTPHPPGSPSTRCATPSSTAAPRRHAHHHRPGRHTARLGWGTAAGPARGHPHRRAHRSRTTTGEITDAALAGYIAKYATKSTGADAARAPTGRSATATHIAYLTSPRTTDA